MTPVFLIYCSTTSEVGIQDGIDSATVDQEQSMLDKGKGETHGHGTCRLVLR